MKRKRGLFPVPIVPKKEDAGLQLNSIRLPTWMWEKLDEIAEETGNSRNAVLVYIIDWGIKAHLQEAEMQKTKKNGGR